jgi:uncharacterized protein (TIGR03437 family)
MKLFLGLCLLMAANAAFAVTLPPCTKMAGSNELCGIITGTLTKVSGPDPLGLSGAVIAALTGNENAEFAGWTSGWSVLGIAPNPGSQATYTVPLTLSASGSALTLSCGSGAGVILTAAASGDSLQVTTCNLELAGISVDSTFAATVNFAAGTLPQALPLPFGSVAIGPNSSATYVCNDPNITACASSGGVATVMTLSNGSISAVCVSCGGMGLTPPSPGPLTFTAQQGGSAPAAQTVKVAVSNGATVDYAVTTSTSSGGNWLSVSPAGGQTGGSSATFSVSVAPGSLAVGSYSGTVKVYAPDSNGPLTETVNFTVTAPSFTLNQPNPLTFTSVNSSVPSSQNVSVATTPSESVPFTAAPSSTGSWLSVSPTSGTTGSSISVSANPSLAPGPGANAGTIALNATGASNNPVTVNVTFNVTTVTTVPSPATGLSFTGAVGGSIGNESLSVTAQGPNVTYTASASSTGNWLGVSPTSGTTNGPALAVSVNTSGLTAKTYNGTIDITPAGGSTIAVPVTLTLSSLPSLQSNPTSLSFSSSAGSTPGSQTLTITSSTPATPISYTVSTTGGSWLSASPASGATQGSEMVSVSVSGLATGTYNGNVVFTCTTGTCGNAGGTLSVPVTLTVTAGLVSPSPVTFNYTVNGTAPNPQVLSVTSNGAAITYTAGVTAGASWLSVSPTTQVTTPNNLTASVNITGLTPNTYTGTITLTPTLSGNTGTAITVSLVVSAEPTLQVSPGTLTFNMVQGGSLPTAQPITVSASNGGSIPFSIAIGPSGNAWLSAPASGNTSSGTVNVSVLANNLTPGTYNGTLTITSPQATGSATVNVQLVVNSISLSPSSLTFNYQLSGTPPAGQTLNVSSALGASFSLNFTAAASVSTPTGGTWLSVAPTSGTTPQGLTVTATPGSLGVGSYSGTITVSSGGANFSIPVTFAVANQPSLTTTPNILSFNYTVGGSLPASQGVTVGSNGTAFNGVTATTSTPWLTIISQSGTTTPFNLTVGLNQTGLTPLTPGPYSGTIVITAAGASNSPLNYAVSLTVSAQPTLTVTPSPLTFTGTVSGANPAAQTLTVSGANGVIGFTAAAATNPPGGTWLSVTPTSGSTNTTLQVSVNTTGLTANTYTGSITVTSTSSGVAGSPAVIPVTLNLSANSLTATPSPLNFTYTLGGTAPAAQNVSIGSTVAGLSFTAASGASWLSVTPGGGTTPQSIAASIVATGLTAGKYTTNITITAAGAGNSPLTVPVNLTVSAEPTLSATPNAISFNYATGGSAPPGVSLAVSTSSGTAAFSVSAVTTGGNWLQFSPSSGTSPLSFLASFVPSGFTGGAGNYTGTITVSAPGFVSATVSVTLAVTQPKAVIQVTGGTLFVLPNTAAPVTGTLAVSASDGSAQPFTIAVGQSPNNWLTLSPTSGTTPANVTMTVTPAGLIPGTYVLPITVTMPALPVPTKTLTAQLTVTGSNLAASPSMLTFTYQPGAALPPAQSVALTTITGGTVPLASVTADVGWLIVSQASSAPVTLKVSINPGLLSPGTYTGNVLVKGVGSPDTSLEIPATITVNALSTLTATPAALTFTYQIGGTPPAAQSFALAAGSAALNFTATPPGSWVQVSPLRGVTPGSVLVTVNPTGLAAGTYGGSINATAIGATNPAAVAVTLTVTGSPQLIVSPTTLSFALPVGGSAPAPQTLTVSSAGASLGFTAAPGSLWLGVTPTSGTTPATLAVSVNPAGLAAGTYNGTINITQAGSSVPDMVIVTLQVGPVTAVIGGVINAASGVVGTVAPGMAISIFGTGLGPQTAVSFATPAAGGTVATTLGGTQVLFDGNPAPILYTSNLQVNALVPFELANKTSTVLQVSYGGETSAGFTLPVVAAEPGLFSTNSNGKGQGAILNQDTSLNSASNPAAPGSAIVLYGTGGGLTIPPSVDGALNPISSTGALALNVTATVGGQPANVFYSGPAPTLVSGIFQINLTLPDNTPAGNIPVIVTVGTAVSQAVTVAVQ